MALSFTRKSWATSGKKTKRGGKCLLNDWRKKKYKSGKDKNKYFFKKGVSNVATMDEKIQIYCWFFVDIFGYRAGLTWYVEGYFLGPKFPIPSAFIVDFSMTYWYYVDISVTLLIKSMQHQHHFFKNLSSQNSSLTKKFHS